MRLAGAEGLRGERRDRRYQAHAEGEADEKHCMRQRRGCHGLGTEVRTVTRRDLLELGQRNRHGELERLGEFDREMAAGHGRRSRCGAIDAFDFVERGHCNRLPPPMAEKSDVAAAAYPPRAPARG